YFCGHFLSQAEDGIRDFHVTGVQTCALPIWRPTPPGPSTAPWCPCAGCPEESAMPDTHTPGALVTGGASGIGRATAIALRDAGYAVTATGLTDSELANARADAAMAGIHIERLDVGD